MNDLFRGRHLLDAAPDRWRWRALLDRDTLRAQQSSRGAHEGSRHPTGFIPERWPRSSRNGGRHHSEIMREIARNRQSAPAIGPDWQYMCGAMSRVAPRSPAQSRRRVRHLGAAERRCSGEQCGLCLATRISQPWSVRLRVSNGSWLSSGDTIV